MTLYMPLFRSCSTLQQLKQLHAHLLITGLHYNPQASTKLIESYAQMGTPKLAHFVFQSYPKPDSFMWGVLIKCFVWNALYKEAIFLYHQMISSQTPCNSFIFPSILRACSRFHDLGIGQTVHGHVIKCGFASDDVIGAALVSMYGELGCIGFARKVFDKMLVRDCVSWSSMILSCVHNGIASEGLRVFSEMVCKGVKVDLVTMLAVAVGCGQLGFVRIARSIHGYAVRQKIKGDDGTLSSSLVVMYSKCGDLISAERLFQSIGNKNVLSWTSMISCYNQNMLYKEALDVFLKMLSLKIEPNSMTMEGVIHSCARLCFLKEGKSVHCYKIKKLIDPELELLGPALMDLYAECGSLRDFQMIFDSVKETTIVMWNMLISLHVCKGYLVNALLLFKRMYTQGFLPESYTLSSVLSVCADIKLYRVGCQIHGYIIKIGDSDEYVHNSLIDLYSKCGVLGSAYMVFDEFQDRSTVTWNSMLCGFSQNGDSLGAMRLFNQMYLEGIEMSEVTFLSTVHACTKLGYLKKGKWLHHKLVVYGINKDMHIDTALADMYAKCGDINMARRVFDNMGQRSVVSWSTMIAGYGAHGHIDAAISLFNRMFESGIEPNEVTFLNILSACRHAGYVKEGKAYFSSMIKDYGIEPKSEHFACVVDLLSRAGDIDGAYEIINSMPFHPDISIWTALLNGCRIHERMDIVKSIEGDLSNLVATDPGYYKVLSSLHAEVENWDKFGRLRSLINHMGLRTVPGYSVIEDNTKTYK